MAQNDWAIVIGINEYEHHPERNLSYAVNDANLMQDFLCGHAGFPEEQVVLCLGESRYQGQPTYPTFANLVRWLNRELHPDRIGEVERFWFFFSGHGLSTEGTDYLITCDSLLEDTQFSIMLPVQQVIASLRQHKQADVVLILDNCREQVGAKNLATRSLCNESLELARSSDIVTIRSCEYGEFSYELGDQKQGAFTCALMEGLKEHTLPTSLERYVQRRVAKLNEQGGIKNRQTPKISLNSSTRGLFPLLPERCVTPADLKILEERAWKAQAKAEYKAAEQLWWRIIRATQSRQMLDEAQEAIQFLYRKTLEAEVRQGVAQELSQLRQQLEAAEQQLQASEGQQAELGQVQQERDRLQQELQAAEQRLQRLAQEQGNAGQLRQEKADLERQLEQVRAEAEQRLVAQQEQWRADAVQQVQAAQEKAQNKAQNTINQLKGRLQDVQAQLEAGEKTKQEALAVQAEQANQIKTLKQKIHTLEQRATPQQTWDIDAVPLNSEGGKVDYTRLRDLLKAGQWKEADRETQKCMERALGTSDWYKIYSEKLLLKFPCADLKTIDQLWVRASQGRYGFSVQKEIYVKCGAKLDGNYPGDTIWYKFCEEVGWRVNNSWVSYSDLGWGGTGVPGVPGNLPVYLVTSRSWFVVLLFSRIETCEV